MPFSPVSGDPPPYFFLGYAHTPEALWVEKLYRDLCTEVVERTTVPVTADVGFMDRSGIPLGSDWREDVAQALATCRVFVPLYSPRYFTREECGFEWHAFVQRIIDHKAHVQGSPAAIVPALWTPVDQESLPEAAQHIQMNHADLGAEYAQEGFYTLIKNSLYRDHYTTAVQRLAQHIIRAAESSQLRPCQTRDLGTPRNAFARPAQQAPADRRLNLVVVAPTLDELPSGRSSDFYGSSSTDWNPFRAKSHQAVAEYAAEVAKVHSYEPIVMAVDEGCDFLETCEPSDGLGLLLVDAWAIDQERLAQRLSRLDARALDWVAIVVVWNLDDAETKGRAEKLRGRLRELLPIRIGDSRLSGQINLPRVTTLEQLRNRLPAALDATLFRYLNHAEAHPPAGTVSARPRLSGASQWPADTPSDPRNDPRNDPGANARDDRGGPR